MKHTFLLFKTLLFCGLFVFFSCQDDTADQLKSGHENHSKHHYLDFEEFAQRYPKPAARIMKKNENSHDRQQKGIYDPQNDFTILTDHVFMAENEGGTYLTFGIVKGNSEAPGLDNLVLKITQDGNLIPMAVHYDLTEQEKEQLVAGEFVGDMNEKVGYQLLEGISFDPVNTNAKFLCVTMVIAFCEYNNHTDGRNGDGSKCPGYQEETIQACSDGGGSGGGGPGPTSPPVSTPNTGNNPGQSGGGGGGNSGNNPPYNPNLPSIPVITTPIPVVIVEDNCAQLKDMMKTPKTPGSQLPPLAQHIPLAVNKLTQGLNAGVEKGFALRYRGSQGNFAFAVPDGVENHVHFPKSSIMYGTMHTHPDNGIAVPMFSPDDIFSLMTTRDGFNVDLPNPAGNSFFVTVMVSKNGVYAIKIDDINKFQTLSNIFNNEKLKPEFERNLEDRYEKIRPKVNGIPNGSSTDLDNQKAFLNFITNRDSNGYDLGISLYKLENDSTTNLPNKKWKKLTLSDNGQNVNKTPCN